MKLPRFYMIQTNLSEEDQARVRAAIDIVPSTGTFVFGDADARVAQMVSEGPVVTFESPMAVIGQFDSILSVINSDGSVEKLL